MGTEDYNNNGSPSNILGCVGVLIILRLFLFPTFIFAAQPKELFLDGLKKLEQ
jgi:hypothetical protein